MSPVRLETTRIRLRQWRDEDLEPFASLNADPKVMEFFPAPLTRTESDAMALRVRGLIEERGWGFWALEIKDVVPFAGFVGMHVSTATLPFSPCVEIGWRLASGLWGRGYATEAAQTALAFGFRTLGLAEIVAFTAVGNRPSRRVMERLGMTHDQDGGFEHPGVPEGHPLRPHVLYRLRREDWEAQL